MAYCIFNFYISQVEPPREIYEEIGMETSFLAGDTSDGGDLTFLTIRNSFVVRMSRVDFSGNIT